MKHLLECIDSNFATPANTLGAGAVQPCESDPPVMVKKKHKMKSLKYYLKNKTNEKSNRNS